MNEKIVDSNNFVEDLSLLLIGFFKQKSVKFVSNEIEFYISEVFGTRFFLPMFLYDKEPIIKTFIDQKNVEELLLNNRKNRFYASLQLCFCDRNLTRVYPLIMHNLDKKTYHELLKVLMNAIINDPILMYKGDNSYKLDRLYDKFEKDINIEEIKKNMMNVAVLENIENATKN